MRDEVDAGPRQDDPSPHEVFDGSVAQHEHVGWLAGDGPLRERADGAGRQRDRVAGLAVEGLGQLADDPPHRARAQHSERHRHVVCTHEPTAVRYAPPSYATAPPSDGRGH